MSYTKSYLSPSTQKFEFDQNERLIKNLKMELMEMRQNEKDYNELSSQLKHLEHRYNLLHEEKQRSDCDFRNRNELHIQTIANLKTEIDSLQQVIQEKNIEYQEMRNETFSLREITDNQSMEISKFKNELHLQLDNNQRLLQEKQDLDVSFENLREEKNQLLYECENFSESLNQMYYKCQELEKQIKEEKQQNKTLDQKNSQLQQNLDSVEIELQQKLENVSYLQKELHQNQRDSSDLEQALKNSERELEKSKQDNEKNSRNLKMECQRNQELQQTILELENVLRKRDNKIENLNQDLQSIKQSHSEAIDHNSTLNLEKEAVQQQLERLAIQNQQLVEEMQNWSDIDDKIKQLLNKKQKLNQIKRKFDNPQFRNTSNSEYKPSTPKSPSQKNYIL